jgi:simple sugar transport system permease protein
MLNFVAMGFASWVTLYLFPNPDSQNPETRAIGSGYLIGAWTPLVLVLVIAILIHLMIKKSVWGYEIKAVGANESAAKMAGISIGKTRVMAMMVGGGIAGLVGVTEVLAHSSRFKLGFSPDFGFMGIAVALLARGEPLAVLLTALLFGALHKGSGDLDFETEKVTRDLSAILQAAVILVVAARGWRSRR